MIDRAEQFLIERGFFEERVRMHGNIARIEVPSADIPRLASDEVREDVMVFYGESLVSGYDGELVAVAGRGEE